MLEGLFEIYFRVLKHCSAVGLSAASSAAAAEDKDGGGGGPAVPSTSLAVAWTRARLLKKCPLLHAVLEGLARWGIRVGGRSYSAPRRHNPSSHRHSFCPFR